jgi:quercetin dioxygenase-like cupin family protein
MIAEDAIPWPRAAIVVDVRPEVKADNEPFLRILSAADSVTVGEAVVVISPFEPRAVYPALQARGFSYESEHVGPDEWITRFTRHTDEQNGTDAGDEQGAKIEENAPHGGVAPATRDADSLIRFDLGSALTWGEAGPGVRVLSESLVARVVLFTFRAGQHLKQHQTSSQILVHILDGDVAFIAQGQRHEASQGTLFQLSGGIPHALEALTQAVVMITMTPSPVRHSLHEEVFRPLMQ